MIHDHPSPATVFAAGPYAFCFDERGDPEATAAVSEVLADMRVAADRSHSTLIIEHTRATTIEVRDLQTGERLVECHPHSLLTHLLGALNRAATRHMRVALHASAAVLHGAAFLVVGPSHAGKSTLGAALGLAHGPLLADEVVELAAEPDRVLAVPYAKPVALRPASGEALRTLALPLGVGGTFATGQVFIALSDINRRWSAQPGPTAIGGIVFPTFLANTTTKLAPVRPAAALVRCMEHCIAGSEHGDEAFRLLERVARTCRAYELRYGDAIDAATTLQRITARASRSPMH